MLAAQFEFVIGMLTKLELLDEKDVETFTKLFTKMDADGSGMLTSADIDAARIEQESRMADLAGAFDDNKSTIKAVGRMMHRGRSVSRSSAVSMTRPQETVAVSERL